MKALFASDLHGETRLYQQLLELSIASSSELIALGGDLLPSFPPSKRYEEMIPNQRAFIEDFLLPFFRKLLASASVSQIFLIPGNWDLGYSHLFTNPDERIIDLNQRNYRLKNGYELIGYPFVPPTPFRPKDYEKMDDPEAPWPPQKNPSYLRTDKTDQLTAVDPFIYLRGQPTIREDLSRLPKPVSQKKAIYLMHSPPFGTRLDLIQGKKFAGSRSIRRFLEENQPFLTLHGHIHEAPELSGSFIDRVGETVCINPGQSASSEQRWRRLHAVTFDIEAIATTLSHTLYPSVQIRE